jgi:cobalamin biosynthesis protein CobD/CbiB
MVSARLDDVANFLPARLSWLLLSASGQAQLGLLC